MIRHSKPILTNSATKIRLFTPQFYMIDHYCWVLTSMATLKFATTVTKPLLQLLFNYYGPIAIACSN